MSAYERTGWRDKEISQRHRVWGFNCPAVDLDFVMAEYHIGKPVGLIEYKDHHARMPDLLHPTYRALADLADGYREEGLPFILAFYWSDVWAFRVYPVNTCAKGHFSQGEMLTELAFVKRLYRLRSLALTEHLMKCLHDELPVEEMA